MGEPAVEFEPEARMEGLATSSMSQWGEGEVRKSDERNKFTVTGIEGKKQNRGAGAVTWYIDRRRRAHKHDLPVPTFRMVVVNHNGVVFDQWENDVFELDTRSGYIDNCREVLHTASPNIANTRTKHKSRSKPAFVVPGSVVCKNFS
eukprot:CAMPEP_0185844248 /NCGR_PEP_ID=MMETSP1354-20130828/476_1 /TAXON_ID=708628 /ORGANISM="Erythrolobus madagascarensis, Strain CCMP3276" /LENGTH=146 /DNA_ID=CAMNT_0028543875 /DNA_START=186 /DNA_END=622 /DNA_ORIENTATION=-